MGLIRAGLAAAGGTLADQWKEFFYCEALEKEVLVRRGYKKTSGRSSNKKGNDNIITSGSGIAVADGQCMIIVEQGKIVEVCAEPGEFTYDASTEPSIFSGSLGEGLMETFRTIGKRITYGGDTGKDQRVYYFNTKELVENRFGTPNPIPFRVVDSKIGLDIDVSIRCSGIYSYKIEDPLLFYANVCGNVSDEYTRDELDGQLDLLGAQPDEHDGAAAAGGGDPRQHRRRRPRAVDERVRAQRGDLLGAAQRLYFAAGAAFVAVLFVLIGFAWAAINVNSYPMVVEISRGADVGRYTGYYYTFSMAAQIVTPMVSGWLLEHAGYGTLFPYAAGMVVVSFITMLFARHGDAKPEKAKSVLENFDAGD